MSSSELLAEQGRLRVEVPPSADVTVVDSGLRVVATGGGTVDVALAPGIYRARATDGDALREAIEVVRPGESAVIRFAAEEFNPRSIVPFDHTRDVNKEHAAAAESISNGPVHEVLGQGGRLFLMVRGHHTRGIDPARGLELLDPHERVVVDFAQAGVRRLDTDSPWAASHIELRPGTYLLRSNFEDRRFDDRQRVVGPVTVTQTLVVSPDWQTQVFLPQFLGTRRGRGASPPDDAQRRPDLVGGAMLLARNGFRPDNVIARADDSARMKLAGRVASSEAHLDELFRGEWQNPMLGLYGGHLLLLQRELDRGLLQEVVRFLRRAFVEPHPDVEALAMALGESPRTSFAVPPMLQSSWGLVIDRSASDERLIPAGSLAERVAGCIWGRGPWLLWRRTPELESASTKAIESGVGDEVSVKDAVAALSKKAGVRPVPELMSFSSDDGDEIADELTDDGRQSPAQRRAELELTAEELAAYRILQRAAAQPERGADVERDLVRSLRAPARRIRSVLSTLTRKLAATSSATTPRTPDAPRPTSGARDDAADLTDLLTCVEWAPDVELGAGKDRAALALRFKWKRGASITVGFLDGDPLVHERVRNVAKLWERYANLEFLFIPEAREAKVRITFERFGASSVLGTACEAIPSPEPTMVLGAIRASSPLRDVHRVVLHEFGHAIGLIHEHQNPADGGIRWNKPVALAHYRRITGWDDAKIHKNVFDAYAKDVSQLEYTPVDPSSIMMYPIPKGLTLDGFAVEWNRNLSKTDVAFVRDAYPGRLSEPLPALPDDVPQAAPAPSAVARSTTAPPAAPKTPVSVAPSSLHATDPSRPRPPKRTAVQPLDAPRSPTMTKNPAPTAPSMQFTIPLEITIRVGEPVRVDVPAALPAGDPAPAARPSDPVGDPDRRTSRPAHVAPAANVTADDVRALLRGAAPGETNDLVLADVQEDADVARFREYLEHAAATLEALGESETMQQVDDERTSVVQAILAEGRSDAQTSSSGLEVMMDDKDFVRWAFDFGPKWIAGRFRRRDFIEPVDRVWTIPNDARIAILGDWGSGLYGAPKCAETITSTRPAYNVVIHLGDVYYAGTAGEVRDRFLKFWPTIAGASSWAVNSNHEMYSGGEGIFDVTLRDPRFAQGSTCFAFQNDSFLFLGLDTAYDNHDLYESETWRQADWVRRRIAGAGTRKVVLLSHHQPYSQFEKGGEKLVAKLRDVLESKRVSAWYWGHEHRCAVFEPHPTYGLKGRCIGHSGYPAFREKFQESEGIAINCKDASYWRKVKRTSAPAALVLDGPNIYIPNNKGGTYAPNGFMSLELRGSSILETVRSPSGLALLETTVG